METMFWWMENNIDLVWFDGLSTIVGLYRNGQGISVHAFEFS